MTIHKSYVRNTLLLLGILALGTFLRFYRLVPNMILNGEMGTDYMNIWNILHGYRSFLIGPRTSHEWFFIPPLAYWIYSIILFFGKYNPVLINIFWGFVGSSAILVCYFYIKKLFDEKVALVTSFLLAVSPAWIDLTRASRYNAPAGILLFPYLYYLKRSIDDKGKSLGILGFILGLSMSFFPSPFLLIPASIICFIFYRIRPKVKYIFYALIGFLLPNITYLFYEAGNGFRITIQAIGWIPYRILGFFGLYNKNNFNSDILKQNIYSVYKFFTGAFAPDSAILSLIIFTAIMAGLFFWLVKSVKNKAVNKAFMLVVINLVVCYLGLFIHGSPPAHYYLVIFPVPIIIAGYLLVRTIKKEFILTIAVLLVGITGITNLFVSGWFSEVKVRNDYVGLPPPYKVQLEVVDKIMGDSMGKDIVISRIGVYDQFENDFANNYIYLLTIRGANINGSGNVRYTIVEDRSAGKVADGIRIWEKSGVEIYKLSR